MSLFATAEFFAPTFLPSLATSAVFALAALVLFVPFWKFIDWLTPGNLNDELLGSPLAGKQPNVALAVVVGALVLGFCLIIAAAIH